VTLVRRYWLDRMGGPHVEEVTLIPRDDGLPGVTPVGPVEVEGGPLLGPVRVLAVHDPACGDDALHGNVEAIYSADLPPGVRIVTRDDWVKAVAQRDAFRAVDLAAYEQAVARRDLDKRASAQGPASGPMSSGTCSSPAPGRSLGHARRRARSA
jgi:hypothetical protein